MIGAPRSFSRTTWIDFILICARIKRYTRDIPNYVGQYAFINTKIEILYTNISSVKRRKTFKISRFYPLYLQKGQWTLLYVSSALKALLSHCCVSYFVSLNTDSSIFWDPVVLVQRSSKESRGKFFARCWSQILILHLSSPAARLRALLYALNFSSLVDCRHASIICLTSYKNRFRYLLWFTICSFLT